VRRLRLVAAAVVLSAAAIAGGEAPEGEPVSELRQLTHDRGIDAMPSWSPSGRRLAYHARQRPEKSDVLPTRKIWLIDRDGQNARKISDGAADEYHAVFSPNGSRMAFVSEANGSRDIWVMDADGKNPLPLTDDPGLEEHPCWSPDGSRIVFTALPKDGGNFDLWVMNADGSGKRKLTSSAANEIFPAWHPLGKTIAFATDATGNYDIQSIALDDEPPTPLVTGPANDTRPAWSPDGTKLAFTRWPAEGRSRDATLWVANADGTSPTELAIAAPALHPAWAPDGRTLAFERGDEGDWNLWTARLSEDLVRAGRLHAARPAGGRSTEDVITPRSGPPLRGAIAADRFKVRAPYGVVELPRRALASIELGDIGAGTAKLVLANGDTFGGLLLDDDFAITTSRGAERVRKEKIAAIRLRADPSAAAMRSGTARIVMRNGDAFGAELRSRSLRLRVARQTVEIAFGDVARVDFGEEGKKTHVVTRKGDTLSGTLESSLLELDLAPGVHLALYPTYIRSLTLTEVSS
jgi:Tol biopolymer transport system component